MGQRLDNARALYLEAIGDGDAEAAISKYAGDRYVQHSTPVRDGHDGFIEFFADFIERNPVRDIEIVRGFEDGQYVFLHVVQVLNDGESCYVTADIFDTDDQGRMIEHWDVIAELAEQTASGHTQIDGPTMPIDLDRTAQNKDLVSRFLDEVMATGDHGRLGDFISTDLFVQHNPAIADGLDGLKAYLAELPEGEAMVYGQVHRVIGCGSFVSALSQVNVAGVEMAVIDLFRVYQGKIVEHWDVMEQITPDDTWVNSGKF